MISIGHEHCWAYLATMETMDIMIQRHLAGGQCRTINDGYKLLNVRIATTIMQMICEVLLLVHGKKDLLA